MSYVQEREAIRAHFKRNWHFQSKWGFDDEAFTPAPNTVRLTIQSGDVRQGSVGRVTDRVEHIGVVEAQIYSARNSGSRWRALADAVEAVFLRATINVDGEPIGAGDQPFVRFSPADQHPYIMSVNRSDAKLTQVLLVAPFVRYEWK